MITTKQKPTVDTEKIKRSDSKHNITKNHEITKEKINKERNKGIAKQQELNKIARVINSIPINNYCKCE